MAGLMTARKADNQGIWMMQAKIICCQSFALIAKSQSYNDT
jgi:hypothetical protein